MLKTFRHKGLKRRFKRGQLTGVRADQVRRIRYVLAHLDHKRTGGVSVPSNPDPLDFADADFIVSPVI